MLGPGDRVPADLWLLRTRGLRLRQAALSGESDAVARRAGTPAGRCWARRSRAARRPGS
ncbi:hypothetical protein [Streptomyces sp. DfronAA-171]|uniref:hypothetical protein n=1 Tax=Streptomyces sp. DfronAA-171 TaxID=1839777 RepID=UPI00210A6E4B|nr:hypothetical protein [Streptomyces sp. DfronAA-171]